MLLLLLLLYTVFTVRPHLCVTDIWSKSQKLCGQLQVHMLLHMVSSFECALQKPTYNCQLGTKLCAAAGQ